jgi:tetratricopeptide (TPR) repeat protein
VLEARTRGALEACRLREAFGYATLWVERSPKSARALVWRGRVYERVGRLHDALPDYRRAVELAPKNSEARLRLGEVLLEGGGSPLEAGKHFDFLSKRRPEDPAALLGLGRSRILMGDAKGAREVLDKLLKKHPRHAGALTERGKVALQEGELKQAEGYLRKAVARDPANPAAQYALVCCLDLRGKREEAEALLPRFQRLQADRKRLEKIMLWELTDDRHDPAPRLEAGTICLRLGRTKEGLRLLHLALKADPRHKPTHRALADYYERAGEKAKAAHHRKLAGGEKP